MHQKVYSFMVSFILLSMLPVLFLLFNRTAAAEDTALKQASAEKPVILVLIDEKCFGVKGRPGFTETEIILQDILKKNGFTFVDSATVRSIYQSDTGKVNRTLNGSLDAEFRRYLVNKHSVKILIVGTTVAVKQKSDRFKDLIDDMTSCRATVKLKAIDLETGEIIALSGDSAVSLHLEPAEGARLAIMNALKRLLGSESSQGQFEEGPFTRELNQAIVKIR